MDEASAGLERRVDAGEQGLFVRVLQVVDGEAGNDEVVGFGFGEVLEPLLDQGDPARLGREAPPGHAQHLARRVVERAHCVRECLEHARGEETSSRAQVGEPEREVPGRVDQLDRDGEELVVGGERLARPGVVLGRRLVEGLFGAPPALHAIPSQRARGRSGRACSGELMAAYFSGLRGPSRTASRSRQRRSRSRSSSARTMPSPGPPWTIGVPSGWNATDRPSYWGAA